MNVTALASGVVFVVLGVLFLLERLRVLSLSSGFVVPVLLVGLGVALLLGGWGGGRRRRIPPPPSDSSD